MNQIIDNVTGIVIGRYSNKYLYSLAHLFNTLSTDDKEIILEKTLYSLSFENKLPLFTPQIKKWDFNAYISEKKGFHVDEYELKTKIHYTPANLEYANYKVLDTVLHEFYHRYTTCNRGEQSEEFKLNLDGYFGGGNIIYYTQPTEMGARQFSIRMLEKLNEYFLDDELEKFIKIQKTKFKEENKNEYKGIKNFGYINSMDSLYEFKARENIIGKTNINNYVRISDGNTNYYLDQYQDVLSIAIADTNLNTDDELRLFATCKDDTLYINNFYGPDADFVTYVNKFNNFEERLECIAKFYEKQTGNKIAKLEISPYFQDLSKNAHNKVILNFTRKDNVKRASLFDKQNFSFYIAKEDCMLESKMLSCKDDIKFSSILNRLEAYGNVDENSMIFLKQKLFNEFGLDNVSDEETRKIFKYFAFKTDEIKDRLDVKKLSDCIDNYFILKSSDKLDEEISEKIIESEEEFNKFINKVFETER